jgi:hypothetical protein
MVAGNQQSISTAIWHPHLVALIIPPNYREVGRLGNKRALVNSSVLDFNTLLGLFSTLLQTAHFLAS